MKRIYLEVGSRDADGGRSLSRIRAGVRAIDVMSAGEKGDVPASPRGGVGPSFLSAEAEVLEETREYLRQATSDLQKAAEEMKAEAAAEAEVVEAAGDDDGPKRKTVAIKEPELGENEKNLAEVKILDGICRFRSGSWEAAVQRETRCAEWPVVSTVAPHCRVPDASPLTNSLLPQFQVKLGSRQTTAKSEQ